MKLRFALLALGIPLLALGGEGLYYAVLSGQQVTTSCDEFARQRPRSTWVRLTGCALDYDAPGYRETNGRIQEIYFLVRPAGAPKDTAAPLLAATKDPNALALVQGTIGDGREPDQEALTVMMLRVVTMLRAARELEGRTRASLIERFQTKRALASFEAALQHGYAVVNLHERPDVVVPAIEAGTGVAAVLLFLVFGRMRRRVEGEPAVTSAEPPVEGPPLPAMLLLNLDASAGPEAIEHAPPLGNRGEVVARLSRTLRDLRFDETGRARHQQRDATLHFELGTNDPVWTVTVRAEGADATVAVRALASATGWRAYVPRHGRFIDALEHEKQR